MMFRSVGLRILWSLLTMTMWLTVVLWLSRLEVKSMKLLPYCIRCIAVGA